MKKILTMLIMIAMSSMTSAAELSALKLLPRQDPSFDGGIRKYEIYTSDDGIAWTKSAFTGELSREKTEKIIPCNVTTKQLKLKILSSYETNSKNAAIADLKIIGKNGLEIDRSKCVITASSNNSDTSYASAGKIDFLYDNSMSTFWITDWKKAVPHPHEITIKFPDEDVVVPSTPTNVAPNTNFSWSILPDEKVAKYLVHYWSKKDKSDLSILETPNKDITITRLIPGSTYSVTVTAVNDRGVHSQPSAVISAAIIDKDFPSAPINVIANPPVRFIDVLVSVNSGPYESIGMIPYPVFGLKQKYKTNIVSEIDPKFPSIDRYIVASVSVDGGEYTVLGKVPYVKKSGQKYKSSIVSKK